MAKVIEYKYLSCEVNHGTEVQPNIEQIILDKSFTCKTKAQYEAILTIAEKEAFNGVYTVEGGFDDPAAPRNVLKGEYITIEGVLYKATENIPNGEPVKVGQNAVATTIEEQLFELKGE